MDPLEVGRVEAVLAGHIQLLLEDILRGDMVEATRLDILDRM